MNSTGAAYTEVAVMVRSKKRDAAHTRGEARRILLDKPRCTQRSDRAETSTPALRAPMQPAQLATPPAEFERVYDWVKYRRPELHSPALIDAITKHPEWLTMHTATHRWTMLHQLVSTGDVALFRQVLAISPQPMRFQIFTRNEKPPQSLVDVVSPKFPEMRALISDLYEHDKLCHLTKWRPDELFADILRLSVARPTWAYTPAVARSWSPAMQLVFKAAPQNLELFLERVARPAGVWAQRYDGLCLLDIALRNVMLRPHVAHLVYQAMSSDGIVLFAPSALPSAANDSKWSLARVDDLWQTVPPLPVARGTGVCPICSDADRQLYSVSINCGAHGYCSECIKAWMETALDSGPFPLRCPGCSVGATAVATERGVVTRSAIRGLSMDALSADVMLLKRVLLQQLIHIQDEASTDLIYRTSKPCPKCSASITHWHAIQLRPRACALTLAAGTITAATTSSPEPVAQDAALTFATSVCACGQRVVLVGAPPLPRSVV